jgi:ATP-dependent Clp protease ATP-binding subunit ClpC
MTEVVLRVFEREHEGRISWTPLGLPGYRFVISAPTRQKAMSQLEDALRVRAQHQDPTEWAREPLPATLDLQPARLELSLRGPDGLEKAEGLFPIVIEQRWTGVVRARIAYHPWAPEAWILVPDVASMEPALRRRLSIHLAAYGAEGVATFKCVGKERLRTVTVEAPRRRLLEALRAAARTPGRAAPLVRTRAPLFELPRLGVDLSRSVSLGTLPLGAARPALDAGLAALLGADRARSVALVGPDGSGRTTLIHRGVRALMETDGFFLHRSWDQARRVFALSARRVLAGMSTFGAWEERLLRIVTEARDHRIVLFFEDAALLGAIGRSRESDRAFAAVLEGPALRGEISILARLTEDGLARLADEAPRLAEAFAVLPVPPADRPEAIRLALDRIRRAEREHPVEIAVACAPAVVDRSSSLFSGLAQPGKSMLVLERLVRSAGRAAASDAPERIEPDAVTRVIAERTGIPRVLLESDQALDPDALTARFSSAIVGQPDAARAVVDLITRIKAGLTAPRRPFATYLFTGPTGTGKTETAKWIARELYGAGGAAAEGRLVRIDMGELSGPDAVARLAGDRFSPEGLLTSRVRAQPFCVVLLDEIEKAHPSALHLLLGVLDEGRLTDANGVTADFTNAVIVMTSNLGARTTPRVGFGDPRTEEVLLEVARAVREFFPPELFNRIDRIVPFRPLDREMARRIVVHELARLFARKGLTERRIAIRATDGVTSLAIAEAFEADLGARSVKKWIEREIGGRLAELVSTGGSAEQRAVYLHVPESTDGPRIALHAETSRARARLEASRLLDANETRSVRELLSLARDAVRTVLADDSEARVADARSTLLRQRRGEAWIAELAQAALDELRARTASLFTDAVEDRREQYEEVEDRRGHEVRVLARLWGGRSQGISLQQRVRTGPSRADAWTVPSLREVIARAVFLRRALRRLAEPGLHSATLAITRLGERGTAVTRMTQLASAIGAAADRVEWIAVESDGRQRRPTTLDELDLLGRGAAPIDRILLRVEGLAVVSTLEGETGTHMLAWPDAPPELIAVQVRAGGVDDEGPEDALRFYRDARVAFERALDRGVAPLPSNPDAILPRVRRMSCIESARTGRTFEVDDDVLGESASIHAPTLRAALVPFFEARATILDAPREGGGEAA